MTSGGSSPFRTCRVPGEAEQKEKGSRFRALLEPCSGRSAAEERLETLRREHHDATHVCWAWRLRSEPHPGESFSDAGEPSGTAGVPILGVLRSEELQDVLGVVVRWFGGTKLGRGGLIRAYASTMALAVVASQTGIVVPRSRVILSFPMQHLGDVHRLLSTLEVEYGPQQVEGGRVRMGLSLPGTDRDRLETLLPGATAGQGLLEPFEEKAS